MLTTSNSGKYLSKDWHDRRYKALHDMYQRDALDQYEKDYLELSDRDIGRYDPRNFNLSKQQKQARGMK